MANKLCQPINYSTKYKCFYNIQNKNKLSGGFSDFIGKGLNYLLLLN